MMSMKAILARSTRSQLLRSFSSGRIKNRTSIKSHNLTPLGKKEFYALLTNPDYQPTLFTPPSPTEAKTSPAKKHKRLKTAYTDNYTAALQLPCSSEELEELSAKDLFEKAKPFIIEHASRRVDLFFYTLVAYYNTKTAPKQGHTFLQHGSGRHLLNNTNVTQGCHSSFLPCLTDKSSSPSQPTASLLSGTHFMDSLNSTVELPPYVNELDNEFENDCLCRKKCLEILDKVAQGDLDPIEGLTEFLRIMDKILKEIEGNYFRIQKFFCKYRLMTPELIKLTKEGTLTEKLSADKKNVSKKYLELLLRLTPPEKAAAKDDPEKRAEIYLTKLKEIQHEILSTKTAYSPSSG